MPISIATRLGLRPNQEDRVIVIRQGGMVLLGIFDGHLGEEAAEACLKIAESTADLPSARRNKKKFLNKLVSAMCEATNGMRDGTTVSLALISEQSGHVSGAVIGDSPVFVRTSMRHIRMSPLHSVKRNGDERDKARLRGGILFYNEYNEPYIGPQGTSIGSAVTRGLGDLWMGDVLLREPEFFSFTVSSHEGFAFAASDGFIPDYAGDNFDITMVAEQIRRRDGDAEQVMRWREKYPMHDNASIALWVP